MKRIFSHPGLLVFAATLLLIGVVNREIYFHTPFHEHGDIALNALQVERAKSFQELYGNYSRFHFNHPGPAFFYAYAITEIVLGDALKLGVSPHGLHLFATLIVQVGFLGLALGIAASWVRAPLFIPLALFLGACHFSAAGNAIVSVWPPHALLMPFLAFALSCASLAAGRGQHLPWVLLSGSCLVHGHVAQPLFVVTLAVAAYAGLLYHRRDGSLGSRMPWKVYPWAHIAATGILIVFLLPLAVDIAKGEQSNFQEILRHLRDNQGDHKKPLKAFLYFLSFLSYTRNQDELFATLSTASLGFFREHVWLYIGWAAALGVACIPVFLRGRAENEAERKFLRVLLGLWVVIVGLCVVWGVMQVGPMFDFNGYFYFSVDYIVLILASAVIARLLARWRPLRWLGLFACAGAAVVIAQGAKIGSPSVAATGVAWRETALAALRADPRPDAPKVLVFAHDDWPEVAAIALALKRAGVMFYVDSAWTFMYQREHELPLELLGDPQAKLSVWRFVRHPDAGPGVSFGPEARIVFEPAELPADGGTIEFGQKQNYELYQLCGLTTPSGPTAWTSRPDTVLQFKPGVADKDVALRILAQPFLPTGKIDQQPTELRFNGELVFSAPFTEPGVLRAAIPKELWNRYPVAHLHLHMPNARSPSELQLSGDVRVLSLELSKLTVQTSDNP